MVSHSNIWKSDSQGSSLLHLQAAFDLVFTDLSHKAYFKK